jgi:hypothetical protein
VDEEKESLRHQAFGAKQPASFMEITTIRVKLPELRTACPGLRRLADRSTMVPSGRRDLLPPQAQDGPGGAAEE